MCIFVVFCVCSLSPSLINYACSNFRSTCTMALMFTLQHEFELSTLPPIPSNSHVGSLFYFLFYYHSQKRLSCSFSSRISSNSRTTACKIFLRHIPFTQTKDCEHTQYRIAYDHMRRAYFVVQIGTYIRDVVS